MLLFSNSIKSVDLQKRDTSHDKPSYFKKRKVIILFTVAANNKHC